MNEKTYIEQIEDIHNAVESDSMMPKEAKEQVNKLFGELMEVLFAYSA